MVRGLLVVLLTFTVGGCAWFGDSQTAGPCGIDQGEWREALAAVETSDPSASGGGDSGEAQSLAHDIAESGCLVGRSRDEVQALLGGDGDVYFLGLESLGVDTLSLEISYTGERVSNVAVVQG